ncbi:response regulator transcription factor [Candidatus Thioglobus sp.]|jgi:two-component system OmpR family response regulator|nr:response regulator transcription factor [Candidatus Thioglobus sp.]MDC1447765.1 response regulator transcription factor [Candidatus Thioglobus sp.]MDC1450550.1 response regulator transcription factor [Candidatus Thioglobus sp.]|tara:strand:+ start:2519 stop:3190 length:672 start_codon:yes stop_codon:yes gene_type:complete
MRIVLIEDNQMLAEGIQKILLDEGHSVDYFVDGERADQHLRYEGADLAIIDINLPNMDGISITKNIRARKQLFPIIILTARGATKDRVIGLDAGADDYLVKPFQMDELDARIRALSRRNTSLLSNTESIGSLAYNRTSRRLYFNDYELTLNRRELTLFEILINKKGQYISKSSLADTQYGIGSDININAIEISISRLRKILSTYNIKITTARGIGYMMDDKLE